MPSSFTIVLSSALVCSTIPPVSVSGTVYCGGSFLGQLRGIFNPIRRYNLRHPSHIHRPWNINQVPIAYSSRSRLRGRLTLRGLALRRNPWDFGESVSHTLCRYSCQHSHFRYLQASSRTPFAGLRNAPLPVQVSDDRNQGSEDPVAICRANPCSIIAISRYSPLHRCHIGSSI